MPWKIVGFTALVFGRAVQTLPQGEFGDLLWPGLDVPELDDPELITWTTYHTEPASTPSRVEHVTSLLHQLSSSATQLATPIVRTPALSHLTPTSRPSIHTSEGHSTQTSIRVTNTSPNTILPTPQTLSPPAELPQRHAHADVWRVVGIAVIAVSVVGTTILAVVFFDQWWSFLCDVCGRRKKRRKYGKEELVPDWERGSWVFRAEGNLPAYPSFGSPPARQTVEEIFPPAPIPRENSQRTEMRGSMYGTSGGNFRRLSPSNGVTMHTPHYTLSRSDTQKTATSEDAYGGLAAE
ncbi:hypothetical protein EDB92DRAFT_1840381 [Lactarius akahatsu]|uniref:Transmembrane protein n=1 Tax=Lactarius akahatsu TaxID=416441 RepID=A0AAD4QB65_9AGAM|nr:hypothetical protein EDB92DRAFT_1840381 [Lactarius akahatsu]